MAYVIMGFGKKGRTTRSRWMDDLHRAATFIKRCSSRGSFFFFSPFVSVGVLTTFFFFFHPPLHFNAFLLFRLPYNYKGLGVFVLFLFFVYYHPIYTVYFLFSLMIFLMVPFSFSVSGGFVQKTGMLFVFFFSFLYAFSFPFKHIIPWSGLDIGYRLAWVPGIFLFFHFKEEHD